MIESIDVNKIESNWNTFEKLCGKLPDENLNDLLNNFAERLIMCPASPRLDQYGAFPGGLIQHSLDVAGTMRKLSQAHQFDLPVESVLKVGLLHDIGKIGDLDNDLFVEQDSEWHREKLGQMYKYNENIQKMSVSHRTLFLLQKFNVSLTSDEWIAIQLAQGSHFEENRFYVGSEPTLAIILQQSKAIVIHKERHK